MNAQAHQQHKVCWIIGKTLIENSINVCNHDVIFIEALVLR